VVSDRCPECGDKLDFKKIAEPQIPWAHRREIGRFKAYWKTVWSHSRIFYRDITRPVSYSDSQRFRWVTVAIAWVSLVAALAVISFADPQAFPRQALADYPKLTIAASALAALCIFLYLAGATGLPSYFFHPNHLSVQQQNRAIALSYYTCAPLAWTPASSAAAIVGMILQQRNMHSVTALALFVFAFALVLGLEVIWLYDLWRLAKHTARREYASLVRFAIALPLLWCLLGGLVFIVIPLIVFYISLIFVSLD
jgi:hypothetical protein